ncbi:hypothetical protein [Adhaeribacter pallidiroseus]|uniref:hypothetical protein n=1 Tax=Adhaeribacter pallidiroseus TaxID=2072847 RepID=UPI0011C0453F|nr:hypothetical protein [Adhaeribacter pallidiroseus]
MLTTLPSKYKPDAAASAAKTAASPFEQAPVAVAIFRGVEYVVEVANTRVAALWAGLRSRY